MKRVDFDKSIESIMELYFKDNKCFDIVYICSEEMYDDELGFDLNSNILNLDYSLAVEYRGEYNLYVMVTKNKEYKGLNEFRLIPKEVKPIRIKFD